jgi:hypothetical protein
MELCDLNNEEHAEYESLVTRLTEKSNRELQNALRAETVIFLQQKAYFRAVALNPAKRNKLLELQWGILPETQDYEYPVTI